MYLSVSLANIYIYETNLAAINTDYFHYTFQASIGKFGMKDLKLVE